MHEAQCGWRSRWQTTTAVRLVAAVATLFTTLVFGTPASATLKYGALEFSGSFESQNLVRHPGTDKFQFIQNRNTARLRIDWDWLQNGKLIDKINVPFIERSKVFLLYRGVYDGFYDLAPTDRQVGQSHFDDLIGGPIKGNDVPGVTADGHLSAFGRSIRDSATTPIGQANLASKPGLYSRFDEETRAGIKFEDTLREAYIDAKLANLPVSLRIGRQQVIWGESDQFRLMDIWNPLDVSWHLQQESWDNIRIPLWLGKGLWDIGELGPLSNTFLEVVYNPFDFQPNQKLEFLPRPWAAFINNPLRDGQVQNALGGYLATRFNLGRTSFRRGDFHRNPQDASEVGVRFHTVTPQGLELSLNYLYARSRGIGANTVLGVKINRITLTSEKAGDFLLDGGKTKVTPRYVDVDAEIKYPYNHIFGLTGNYFEGDFTSAVLRFESAYVMGEPNQTIAADKVKLNPRPGSLDQLVAPLGYDKRDVWAGMVGADRPTWLRFLNSKSTWFLTGQFFWSYTYGNIGVLRGNSGAGETPYFTPRAGQKGSLSQGVGQWASGPFAGLVERLQDATADPSGDNIRHWEHLLTLAGTSFYRGGTVVPFIADAYDPVNQNNEVLWMVDYFYTNDFIIQVQQKFFTDFGSNVASNDPWGAGGRNHRRDETGIKLTYQF